MDGIAHGILRRAARVHRTHRLSVRRDAADCIRAATLADVPAVARVHVRSWRETYPGLLDDEVIASFTVEEREGRWRELLGAPRRRALFVAEVDGAVVGFASGGPNRGEPAEIPGELHTAYVLAAYQGRGLGAALVARVREHLVRENLTPFVAWVVAGNPASGFYDRIGRRFVTQPTDIRGYPSVEFGYVFEE